jgi:hypothetical protein
MEPTSPTIDNRSYQALLDESLARIHVHTPEWTNFGQSDPGVTIVEVFAFLTENLLYRANQIPERNQRKFLELLGVPLQPASSARGIIVINNEKGPLKTDTLNSGLEVRSKQIPFRTERGLDVLPVEGRAFYKQKVTSSNPEVEEYYKQLYASYFDPNNPSSPTIPSLYQTVPLVLHGGKTGAFNEFGVNPGVDLSGDTVDKSLWIALLLRKDDAKSLTDDAFDRVRAAIAGKTLSLGIVPWLEEKESTLRPPRQQNIIDIASLLRFEIPAIPASGRLHTAESGGQPAYKALAARTFANVLEMPGTVELTLPASPSEMTLWNDLDPLEPGADDLPPALDDTELAKRVITWVRVRVPQNLSAHLLWCGINATTIIQRLNVSSELVGTGTGEPDQVLKLANAQVLPGSVVLTITPAGTGAVPEEWREIYDLFAADPEVLAPDLRLPPGQQKSQFSDPNDHKMNVFVLDRASGKILFGDGAHGRRPPFGCTIRADYAYSSGSDGNVAAGTIDKGSLPDGFATSNPVRTWGGADAETVSQGERQITRYLQHRDRLVTAEDFKTIVLRTPGAQIGRLEVLPTYHPESKAAGMYAPGAVTLLLLPLHDPDHPGAPQPDRVFLSSVSDYVNDRRLVTTEVVLSGPDYVKVFVAVGLQVDEGTTTAAAAEVREAVRQAIEDSLSPYQWRLNKSVLAIELSAVAARVPGVQAVKGLKLAQQEGGEKQEVPISGLQLPELAGLSVTVGDPASIDEVRGAPNPDAPTTDTRQPKTIAIPVVPDECK